MRNETAAAGLIRNVIIIAGFILNLLTIYAVVMGSSSQSYLHSGVFFPSIYPFIHPSIFIYLSIRGAFTNFIQMYTGIYVGKEQLKKWNNVQKEEGNILICVARRWAPSGRGGLCVLSQI